MWMSRYIFNMLAIYEVCPKVGEVIIIDNDTHKTPDLSQYKKVRYLPQKENIYVNPAWNLGASLARYEIILANDDVLIDDLDRLLTLYEETEYTIVGINYATTSRVITGLKRFPASGWGGFLYVRNYLYIPEQLKIWRGDYFLFSKLNPAWVGGFFRGNISETVKSGNYSEICGNDIREYASLKSGEFNVIVRTSNRPNYYKNCVDSIRRFMPEAKIHTIIDTPEDLEYVKRISKDNYYLVNKETVKNFCDKIPIERTKYIYNYYLNIVKPFLKGWVMVLDDDDVLINTPVFDKTKTDSLYLYRVDLVKRIAPSETNYGKIVMNDISMIGAIYHSSQMIDFTPQVKGDFTFIEAMSRKCNVVWNEQIISKSQTGNNHGRRNDIGFKIENPKENRVRLNPYHISEMEFSYPVTIDWQFEDEIVVNYYTSKSDLLKDIKLMKQFY